MITSVEIPDSVIAIGDNAFGHCEGLEHVKLPKKMDTISTNMFYGCKKLVLDILEGITEVRSGAFACCSMKTIKIPASVKIINEAFTDNALIMQECLI